MTDDPAAPTTRAMRRPPRAPERFGLDDELIRDLVARRIFGDDADPSRIDRYPILQRLGSGRRSVVYAAYDTERDGKVAIALFHRGREHDETADARMRARRLRSARTIARLRHPAIAQVLDAGEYDGRIYVVMELVRGATLRQWRDAAARTWREILGVYVEAGSGLSAGHAAGLVHGDFGPDDAIVSDDPSRPSGVRVRVLELGMGAVASTLAYAAPERGPSAQADQFSFAVALFEALHGRRPFEGHTREQLDDAARRGQLVETTRLPARVARGLRRALAHDPAARHGSMEELLAELGPASRSPWWQRLWR